MVNENSKNNIIIFIVSFFVIFTAILPLFNKGFPRTHDDNLYMTWLYEFDQGFREGNLLPRWSGNLWFGYGAPLFNYIQPFFYYLAEGFHLLGFSLIISVKLIIILSVLFSFLFMFLLIKEFWGKWPALVLSTLYIYLPYRIGLLYIRGDFSEYLATAWFPLIIFSFYKFLKTGKLGYFLLSSFSVALLFLTHNIQTVLFLPVLVIYILVFFWGKIKKILKSILAIIYGALLAGFFWIPAFFERKYTQIESLKTGRYDFHQNFITLKQLLLPHWGTGDFYQVGAIGILILIFIVYVLIKHKKIDFNGKYLIFFFILIIFSLFLTTKASTLVWENVPLFSNFQFPWRFLSLAAFGLTLSAGFIVLPEFYRLFIKRESNRKYYIILTLFVFVFSLTFFVVWNTTKPLVYLPAREDSKYSVFNQLFDEANFRISDEIKGELGINTYAWLPDILPKDVDAKLTRDNIDNFIRNVYQNVLGKEESLNISKIDLLSGEIKTLDSKFLAEEYRLNLMVSKEAVVAVNTFWFPGWHAYIDDKEINIDKNNPLGLMEINVPEGEHVLRVEFHNTPLRNAAAIISLAAFLLLIILFLIFLIRKIIFSRSYVDQKPI